MDDEVEPSELLGRGVFSGKEARDAANKGLIRASVFSGWDAAGRLSVDRLTKATPAEAVENGEAVARKRSTTKHKRSFYGWAVVSALDAERNNRHVEATPQEGNPHHADVVLPDQDRMARERRLDHALDLASHAEWREKPRPSSTSSA